MVERSLVPLFDEPQRDAPMDKVFNISVKHFVVLCVFLYATALLNGFGVGYVFFAHRFVSKAVTVDPFRTSGPSAPRSFSPASVSRTIPPPSVPTGFSSPSGADARMPIVSMSNQRSYNPHLSGRSFENGNTVKNLNATGATPTGAPVATPAPPNVEHHPESRATEPPAVALHEATTSIYDWREKSVGK